MVRRHPTIRGWGRAALGLTALMAACAHQVRYAPMPAPRPDSGPADATIFLVGDAGEENPRRDAVLAHLRTEVSAASADGRPVAVIYLGDNIYEVGARAGFEAEDRAKLDAQIEPLGDAANVRGVFVPGNHDWALGASTAEARGALDLQRQWIAEAAESHDVALLPGDGCPGPATAEIGTVHLVMIDTEWLLREPDDACGSATDFYRRLQEDLTANASRSVVLLSHHPVASGGPHGGNIGFFSKGPLVFYLASKSGVSIQDLASGAYSGMIQRLEEAIDASGTTPLVHAAGHDHNLQVLRLGGVGQPAYQLVSGSGAKTSKTTRIDGTRYATDGHGYMRLDFRNVDAHLTVFAQETTGGPVRAVFACGLADSECPEARLVERRP